LLIDETKLCTPVDKEAPLNTLNRLATEGRKFGLGLVLSSQSVGHVSRDVLVNSFTKILMRVDKTESAATARRFRLDEILLQSLERPGQAFVNFAESNEWKEVMIGQ
jgi:DNA helicase HerA-like ATPase